MKTLPVVEADGEVVDHVHELRRPSLVMVTMSSHLFEERYCFLSVIRYATSASTSSFAQGDDFIGGLRWALVLAAMPGASTIHSWTSAAESLLATPSRGPFLLPLPPIE